MIEKSDIRNAMKMLRHSVDEESAMMLAGIVEGKISGLRCFDACTRLFLYSSLPDELPTLHMIEKWSKCKSLYMPRVSGDGMMMVAYGTGELRKGAYNIYEPSGDDIVDSFNPTDVAIIPRVAFDRNCNRLGRGKGYYDKFLAGFCGVKIGVCLDFRLIDHIPCNQHDVPMDAVITPDITIVSDKSIHNLF